MGGVETLSTWPDCEKDDVHKFNTDFTTVDVKNIKCDPSETDKTGTWAFKAGETILTLTDDGGPTDYTIVILTSTSLQLNSMAEDDGVLKLFEITLVPK